MKRWKGESSQDTRGNSVPSRGITSAKGLRLGPGGHAGGAGGEWGWSGVRMVGRPAGSEREAGGRSLGGRSGFDSKGNGKPLGFLSRNASRLEEGGAVNGGSEAGAGARAASLDWACCSECPGRSRKAEQSAEPRGSHRGSLCIGQPDPRLLLCLAPHPPPLPQHPPGLSMLCPQTPPSPLGEWTTLGWGNTGWAGPAQGVVPRPVAPASPGPS